MTGTLSREQDSGRLAKPRLADRLVVRWITSRAIAIAVAVATAALFLLPLYYVFEQALTGGAAGVRQMVRLDEFGIALRTTVLLTLGASTFAVVAGTLLAWFAHCLPPRRRWLGYLPMFPLVVPPLAIATGYAFLANPRVGFLNSLLRSTPLFASRDAGPFDVYSVRWIILITGLTLSSFVFLFVRSALSQLHQELLDAASVNGASPFWTFVRVTLPVIRPALIYGWLTSVLLGLGQFTTVLILGRQQNVRVLTTEMYYHTSTFPSSYPVAAAYGLPVLVAGITFLIFQRVALRNQSRYVVSGGKSSRPLVHNGFLAQLCLVLYGLFAVVLPLFALVVVSLQPYWYKDIQPELFTLEHFREVFSRPQLVGAIRNSLLFALGATALTVPLGFFCARAIHRRAEKPFLASVQELIVSLPLGIPAVIFGTGFLITFTQSPIRLYGTSWSIILVHTAIMIPFATRLQLVAMTSLGTDLSDAAGVSGASPLRRFLKIELPLLRPALGAAAALIIVLSTHEFSASVLVRTQRTQVMGTVLFDLWGFSSYSDTAVMALVMCVVTGLGIVLALAVGGRSALRQGDALGV